MARGRTKGRSSDWGFPRWRAYGEADQGVAQVRLCDRHGCAEPGDCPAPKAPNRPERWYFCQRHAAEYNAQWDYFAGMSEEDAAVREGEETRDAGAYRASAHYGWGGSGDGTRSQDELRALDLFDLPPDADFEAVRKAWRAKAKEVHPDVRPGDAAAARAFAGYHAAYEVLRVAEEAREWKG